MTINGTPVNFAFASASGVAATAARRALIGQRDRAAGVGFTLRLALHQEAEAAAEDVDLARLAGDNLREVFDRAGQVGDLFFERGQRAGHGGILAAANVGVKSVRNRCGFGVLRTVR